MSISGHVENGVVVPDEPSLLPEGAKVRITLAEQPVELPTLGQDLLKFSGLIKGGYPTDLALNHDHYLHGTPGK